MKKFLAMTMAILMMLALSATAETRTALVEVNGDLMELEETLFAGESGYSLWYAPSVLDVQADAINDCFYPKGSNGDSDVAFLVVAVDINPDEAGGLITEATGGYDDSYTVSKIREVIMEGGISVSTIEARGNGTIDRYYLVKDNAHVLCITATYPVADEFTYGSYFETMVGSIRF